MTLEAEFVIELWENLKEFIPNSKKEEFANVLLTACLNFGFTYAEISPIEDEDQLLGSVLKNLIDPEDEEELEIDEEDDY